MSLEFGLTSTCKMIKKEIWLYWSNINENIKRRKADLSLLFYIYLTLMLIIKGLGFTDGTLYRFVVVLASFSAVGKILLEKHSILEWSIIFILLLDAIIVWCKTGNQGLMWTALMCLSVKGISISHAFRYGGCIWGGCFLIQIFTHLMGLANFDYVVHNKWGLGHTIRWAMGYSHPNVMQISYTVLIMYLFYSFVRDKNFKRCIVYTLLGWGYTFLYSLSLTGSVMLLTFLFLSCCQFYGKNHKKIRGKLLNILMESVSPISGIFAIAAPLVLQGKYFDLLNKIFQTRPFLSKTIWNICGVHLFGVNFSGLGRNLTLDCSYMNLLIGGGILGFLVVMALYIVCIHYILWHAHDAWAGRDLSVILTVAVAAISEPFAFNTSFKNISLFIVGARMYQILQAEKEYGIIDTRKGGDSKQKPCVTCTEIFRRKIHGVNERTEQNRRKEKYRILTVAIIIGVLAATWAYRMTPTFSDLYGSRRYFDDIENYPEEYFDTDQIDELAKAPNVRILDYRDSSEAMVHFSSDKTDHINFVERIRASVSAFAIGVSIAYIIGRIIRWRCM